MTKRLLVPAAALVAALMGSVLPAGADPSRNAFQLTLDCGAAGSPTINVFSNGAPSPGLDADSNSVFVPTSIQFTGTFYPADGSDPQVVEEEHWATKGQRQGIDLVACTFGFTDTFDDGTFVGDGAVTGFKTPRG